MAQRTLRTRMLYKLLYLIGPDFNLSFNEAFTKTMDIYSKSFGKNRDFANMSNQLWNDYLKLKVCVTDGLVSKFDSIKAP